MCVLLTHNQSIIHSFSHSFVQSFHHSIIRLVIHLVIHSFIHSSNHLVIQPFHHSVIHFFIYFSIVEHIYRCRLLTRNLLTSEHLSTSQHSKRNVSFTKTSVTLWHLKTMSWETITEEWWWSHRKNDSCCCSNVKLTSRRRKRSWENWKTISFTWRGCLTLNFKRTWNSNNRFQPWKKLFQKILFDFC